MMSKRAVTAAAVAGTAAVLLASGSAYACSIGDFTAKATCDTSTGEAKAAITVTDEDSSGTPADITVRIRMASGFDGETVGTGHIDHFTSGVATATVLVPWRQGYQWNVAVTAGSLVDERLTDLPISPDTPCVPDASQPSSTATATSPAPSTSPAAPAASNSPTASNSPAASTSPAPASVGAAAHLAATGGGSSTGLLAGSAAAAVAVGGGVLFMLRRRTVAGRH